MNMQAYKYIEQSLEYKIRSLVQAYQTTDTKRHPRLFTEFLYPGYVMTTLPTVSPESFEEVILAKMQLGMLITLYDDLADNPHYYNPKLLRKLYSLTLEDTDGHFDSNLKQNEKPIFELAQRLVLGIKTIVQQLPYGHILIDIINFDLEQIYLANKYSEKLTANPFLQNIYESKLYGPYNMGMVAAGMIDLVASPCLNLEHVGAMREVFALGQRMGRIANLCTTYDREIQENDFTNEAQIYYKTTMAKRDYFKILLEEFDDLAIQIKEKDQMNIAEKYVVGLYQFLHLHIQLKEIL